MKNSKTLQVIIFTSGLIATIIGGAILINPVAFHAANDIELSGNVNLLNEIRASGGALLVIGTLIISGCFVQSLRFSALLISSLLYLAYGISRVLSFTLDGIPSEGLVMATGLEILIGLVCVWCFARYRLDKNETSQYT